MLFFMANIQVGKYIYFMCGSMFLKDRNVDKVLYIKREEYDESDNL